MNKKNIMPVAVLTVICVIVAALLGAVHMLTAPVVTERNEAAVSKSLGEVMQGGQFNSEPDALKNDAPSTVKKVYTEKNGMGTVVVLLTNKGYTGKNIGLTVGIDKEGKITGMKVTQNEESIVPNELKPGGTYGNHYVGASAEDIPELSTGATVVYTEGAIKDALNDAFAYLGFIESKPELPRNEAEIENLARALYGDGANKLKSLTPAESQYVKRIYKEDGKSSFIAYAFAYSQYGTPEFEFLIHVDENGSVKAIKKILWKVSDAKPEWGYNPPSDEVVDSFFGSFVGKDSNTVPEVDISTGATNTAGKVRDAAAEAIKLFVPSLPREISEIKTMATELYAKSSAKLECIELEGYDYSRLVFFEQGESSYIVYSVNYSRYGTPEFEFLIHVDENGSVKAVKKILWKVSDAKPEWGYNPPSDEVVDSFFGRFVGKNSSTISSVEVETGATNTASGVRDAALEALGVTFDRGSGNAPRIVGIVILSSAAVFAAAMIILYKKRRALK